MIRGELDETLRAELFARREQRPKPARDDKAIASWNGLAIAALAEAGRRLERPDYVAAAAEAADFLLRGPELVRSTRAGRTSGPGFLDDYANVAHGLLELHVATGELRWLEEAHRLARLAVERFGDDEHGGFFLAPRDGERLVAARKDLDDHPIPSGNAMLAHVLLRLARIYGDDELERRAVGVFRLLRDAVTRAPVGLRLGARRARPPLLAAARARGRRPARQRRRASGARSVDAADRRRRRARGGRAAPRRQEPRRRAAGGLRLRALRLPRAGDGSGSVRRVRSARSSRSAVTPCSPASRSTTSCSSSPARRGHACCCFRPRAPRARRSSSGFYEAFARPRRGVAPVRCSGSRRPTSARSSSSRTRSSSAAATPRTCSRSGACTASTGSCARRGRPGSCSPGSSAGSICWFEAGVTDSFREELDGLDCLGFLPGSNCPHYDGEAARRPAFHRLVAEGFPAGFAADDFVGLRFSRDRAHRGRHLAARRGRVPRGARERHGRPSSGSRRDCSEGVSRPSSARCRCLVHAECGLVVLALAVRRRRRGRPRPARRPAGGPRRRGGLARRLAPPRRRPPRSVLGRAAAGIAGRPVTVLCEGAELRAADPA